LISQDFLTNKKEFQPQRQRRHTMGRILLIIAQLMWIATIIGHWFTTDKIDTIYGMCVSIGLMIISNRMIDDKKNE